MMTPLSLPIAFLAGLVSFLSPCILPLVPAFLTFLASSATSAPGLPSNASAASASKSASRRRVFLTSLFFVLGFSLVFSVLGVLLQSALSGSSYEIRTYLGYVGGAFIVFFGLVLMGLIRVPALEAEHKLDAPKTPYQYASAFFFGAAFAVGWTPCVGAVLASVLALAATQPQAALPLMLAYSLGLGVPFLLAGAFLAQARGVIAWLGPHLKWLNLVFGLVLVVLGILVFTNKLVLVSNLFPVGGLFGIG